MPTISEVRSVLASTCGVPDLVGGWDFRRRLVDDGAGLLGRASGTLTVALDGEGFRWYEVGELTWDGRRAPINRTLGFTVIDDEWWVTFADGRPFHPWRFGVAVSHPCRDDTYRGLLRVDGDGDRLRIGWDVTGPAKQQRILTTYRRVS